MPIAIILIKKILNVKTFLRIYLDFTDIFDIDDPIMFYFELSNFCKSTKKEKWFGIFY